MKLPLHDTAIEINETQADMKKGRFCLRSSVLLLTDTTLVNVYVHLLVFTCIAGTS